MIETMERSTGNVLGYTVSGDMTKADYQTLVPAVEAAIKAHGSVSLLFDLTGFHWEKVNAWGSDLNFGKQFHADVDKMAIVGDKGWERHIAKLAQPYYAREAKYFETDDDAWDWLNG
ncbi:MAG: STAS/SEC14 domain-containing protein [Acidimicrobiia bacterium]|nr:STAS/SEC14 domain-containing protein [Acidimicrobiia bacterium]